jgi:hypothetical protein
MIEFYSPNMIYVAKIIAERRCGRQECWKDFYDEAKEIILLVEQLGFLNKKKFWKYDNNQGTALE